MPPADSAVENNKKEGSLILTLKKLIFYSKINNCIKQKKNLPLQNKKNIV